MKGILEYYLLNIENTVWQVAFDKFEKLIITRNID